MGDLNLLMQEAWEVRQRFEPVIDFFTPGAKHYENRYYSNRPFSFVNISVTGRACACRCDHCNGQLLCTMLEAVNPCALRKIIDRLIKNGTSGILISGGSDYRGEVPLISYIQEMKYAKDCGLKVLVHGGLVRPDTAAGLKEAGVDQVLMDVIGHENTIRQVYHLDLKPDDYLKSMQVCRQAGLNLAPHVVIGLHYGQILGEVQALEMISQAEPETLVMVVLTPARGTAMSRVLPPSPDDAARVMARARLLNPGTPLTLGCARPAGAYKRQVERRAVDCGVNGMAYPEEDTVLYAREKGLEIRFREECCSLAARKEACALKLN